VPDEIEETQIAPGKYNLAELLTQINLAASKKEAKRLIEQGGVKINGEKISDTGAEIEIDNEILLQVGKRKFLKVKGK
jgi:tyrosyl-tRNA synthetase